MKLSMAMSGSMWLALRKAITWRPVISSMAPVRSACLLVGSARVEHEVCLAVADEAALALGQQILHDDGDQVVVEVRSCLGGAAARVLAEEPHSPDSAARGCSQPLKYVRILHHAQEDLHHARPLIC
jgi:hypothetical protein